MDRAAGQNAPHRQSAIAPIQGSCGLRVAELDGALRTLTTYQKIRVKTVTVQYGTRGTNIPGSLEPKSHTSLGAFNRARTTSRKKGLYRATT